MYSGQLRAARALLQMSQAEFAKRAGLSVETIKRVEAMPGVIHASDDTISKIIRVLVDANIELLGPGDISLDGGGGIRVRYVDGEASMQQHIWEVFDEALNHMIARVAVDRKEVLYDTPEAVIDACLEELNGSREHLVHVLSARLKSAGVKRPKKK